MKNKINPESWFICWHNVGNIPQFMAKVTYMLADETNEKSHRFATFEEAYQWVKNQVNMATEVGLEPTNSEVKAR